MKHRIVLVIIFFGLSFFLCNSFSFFYFSTVGTISSCCLYPVLRIQEFFITPIQHWLDDRSTIAQLTQRCILLQKERDLIFSENVALKGLRCHAQKIDELLQFKKRYERTGERVVQVLARHLSSHNQFFLINAGSQQGIKKGMVALYGNCLLGKVADVYPWYCKVHLITDAECKVAAVGDQSGASGIHEGINNSEKTMMRYVSHLEKIHKGDLLLSSGEGLIFPQGFALGSIVDVEQGDLFYSIIVQPAVNFYTVQYCTLLAKSDIENGNF